jgi:hypothetical protein
MSPVETEYRGATLRVDVDNRPGARLYINNIQRAEDTGQDLPCVFRLGSTVQTDYEWHEHIEAVVSCTRESSTVVLSANNKVLIERSMEWDRQPA